MGIYVVDDEPFVTELYRAILGRAGYTVISFQDRARALATLATERNKPDLLITDYLGNSMPVERFMQQCRRVHPSLRILMISGFHLADVRFSQEMPDRFMQKPFRLEEFRNEVNAALAA